MGTLVLFKGLQLREQTGRKHLGDETVPAVGLFMESHTFTATSAKAHTHTHTLVKRGARLLCSVHL